METLHEDLRVQMETASGLLRFYRSVYSVHTSEASSDSCSIAAHQVCAIALRAFRAESDSQNPFEEQLHNNPEAIHSCQGVSCHDGSPGVCCRKAMSHHFPVGVQSNTNIVLVVCDFRTRVQSRL